MTNARQPSILRWGTICAFLLAVLIAEISAIHALRASEQSTQAKIEAVNAAIVRLGPQAATKEQLEACVAEFKNGDKDIDTDYADPMRKAALTMDIARKLAASGMDEFAAQNCATAVADEPLIQQMVNDMAGMEGVAGVALSDVKSSDQGTTRQVWMIAFTCATSELASVLDVVNHAAYKIAITGMKLENRADETVATEIYLETDKPAEAAR